MLQEMLQELEDIVEEVSKNSYPLSSQKLLEIDFWWAFIYLNFFHC